MLLACLRRDSASTTVRAARVPPEVVFAPLVTGPLLGTVHPAATGLAQSWSRLDPCSSPCPGPAGSQPSTHPWFLELKPGCTTSPCRCLCCPARPPEKVHLVAGHLRFWGAPLEAVPSPSSRPCLHSGPRVPLPRPLLRVPPSQRPSSALPPLSPQDSGPASPHGPPTPPPEESCTFGPPRFHDSASQRPQHRP